MRLKDIEEVLNKRAYSISFADKQRIKSIEIEMEKFKQTISNNKEDIEIDDKTKKSHSLGFVENLSQKGADCAE